MESPTRLVERFRHNGVELVCPACREAALSGRSDGLSCPACYRGFPVVDGLPDLRLTPDRFLTMEEDRAKGVRVLETARDETYRAALESYWAQTPELASALQANHLARQLTEAENGRALLEHIRPLTGPLLDLGCGQAGLLEAAGASGLTAVGLEAAFRWLLVARRRLSKDALIVCANAEAIPFRTATFPMVVANDLMEHVTDAEAVIESAAVVCSERLYVASNNRWSAAPEPHVRLFGVGWLPRRWQRIYVQAFRDHDYSRVRLPSRREVEALLTAEGFDVRASGSAPVFGEHLTARWRRLADFASRLGPWAPRFEVDGRRTTPPS